MGDPTETCQLENFLNYQLDLLCENNSIPQESRDLFSLPGFFERYIVYLAGLWQR